LTPDRDAATVEPRPLDKVAGEQLCSRLRAALELAENHLPQRLEELRELLATLADQADAWHLTRSLDVPQHSSRLTQTPLERAGGEPVSEFLLIPFGHVQVERPLAGGDFVFTRRHAEAAVEWFERIGRKLAIDYEHQSFDRYNPRPDGLRPAAGWIGRLEVRDDGLWACDVTWTERARHLLASGEYRYFSPVIYWSDEDCTELAALGPVALTNDPAMRNVPPLAAGTQAQQPGAVLTARPLESEQSDELDQQIAALEQRIELLQKQLKAQEADAFVSEGMRLGKIVDANSMDWREDFLRDPQAARARLHRAPVILPPGRVLSVNQQGRVEPLPRGVGLEPGGLAGESAVEPADLETYERARAAGRVVHG